MSKPDEKEKVVYRTHPLSHVVEMMGILGIFLLVIWFAGGDKLLAEYMRRLPTPACAPCICQTVAPPAPVTPPMLPPLGP